MDKEKMKKVENEMGLLMGITIGFVLTMVGLLSAGQLTPGKFISSFLISFVISQIVTRIIPVQKITAAVSRKFNFPAGSLKQRLLETLISNIFYSPIMTFIMVFIAYKQSAAHGAKIPFGPMLLRSEGISFIVSYILIFIITPIYKKIVFSRNGIEVPGPENKKE